MIRVSVNSSVANGLIKKKGGPRRVKEHLAVMAIMGTSWEDSMTSHDFAKYRKRIGKDEKKENVASHIKEANNNDCSGIAEGSIWLEYLSQLWSSVEQLATANDSTRL